MRYLSVLLLLFVVAFSSCYYLGYKRIRGNGIMASEERQTGRFTGVRVKGYIDVIVNQGTDNNLKIEGDQNLLKYIQVVQNGDVVEISTAQGIHLSPRAGLRVYATAPAFSQLYISGSGNLKSQNTLTSSTPIEATISGSGDMNLNVDAPAITAGISGSGDVIISGTTRDFKSSIAGSGDIKCFNLLSETASVDIAGSGDAQVSASKQLNVDIKGAGDVRYKGNPSINKSIKGSGSVTAD